MFCSDLKANYCNVLQRVVGKAPHYEYSSVWPGLTTTFSPISCVLDFTLIASRLTAGNYIQVMWKTSYTSVVRSYSATKNNISDHFPTVSLFNWIQFAKTSYDAMTWIISAVPVAPYPRSRELYRTCIKHYFHFQALAQIHQSSLSMTGKVVAVLSLISQGSSLHPPWPTQLQYSQANLFMILFDSDLPATAFHIQFWTFKHHNLTVSNPKGWQKNPPNNSVHILREKRIKRDQNCHFSIWAFPFCQVTGPKPTWNSFKKKSFGFLFFLSSDEKAPPCGCCSGRNADRKKTQ